MVDKILTKFQFFWEKIGIYRFLGSLITNLLSDMKYSKWQSNVMDKILKKLQFFEIENCF